MEFFKRATNIQFMPHRRWWYGISALLLLGSAALIAARGINFGIDFTGGVVLEMSFPGDADLDMLRDAMTEAGHEGASVQNVGGPREVLIRLTPPAGANVNEIGEQVMSEIREVAPGAELRRIDLVGSQVGSELADQGAMAAIFAFILILIYVALRFQWKLGIGSILAAMHDPIVVLGFFAATQLTFDLATMASVLAVVGYSLNDTVVVFDRIRERFLMTRKGDAAETINRAINDTLPRTLMTSITTLIAAGSLLLFGGEALRGFSIALVIGVVVGTYSSIYIASSIALDLKLEARDLMSVRPEKDAVDDMP